jgi:peptide/nickel transport system ATP-binding protein
MGTELNGILEINDLRVAFKDAEDRSTEETLKGVSFSLKKGEMLALVGESGSGKTLICHSVFGLLGGDAVVLGGSVRTSPDCRLSLVLQDPMSSLDPSMQIGKQIAEALPRQMRREKNKAAERVRELLELVGIPDPEKSLKDYPSHFSGGMRQRVAVAIALAMEPDVIFADEPTTSLDAGLSRKVMELFQKVRTLLGASILFITHDLGLVRTYANRILIIEDGRIIEEGAPASIFESPAHAYTKRLIRYAHYADGSEHTHGNIHFHDGMAHTHPGGGEAHSHYEITENSLKLDRMAGEAKPVLSVHGVTKRYRSTGSRVKTVIGGMSFDVFDGETLGLAGRSGIGKSTLARILCKMEAPSSGEVVYGEGIKRREDVQMIFQDSRSALNPRMRVRDIVAEALHVRDRVRPDERTLAELMERVELPASLLERYPHEISGGERQRVAIARAVSISPRVIVADEPVSSLDVTVRNKIVHLLQRLKTENGMTLVLISHDLPLLTHVCDRILTLRDRLT